jgi:hypothetical protein
MSGPFIEPDSTLGELPVIELPDIPDIELPDFSIIEIPNIEWHEKN